MNSQHNMFEYDSIDASVLDNLKDSLEETNQGEVSSWTTPNGMPTYWTDSNDVDQPINRDTRKAIHTAIVQRGFEIHARQREMKTEIEQITDFETLEAYRIGWSE